MVVGGRTVIFTVVAYNASVVLVLLGTHDSIATIDS